MTEASLVLFAAAAGLAVWSYLVYPRLLRRIATRCPEAPEARSAAAFSTRKT